MNTAPTALELQTYTAFRYTLFDFFRHSKPEDHRPGPCLYPGEVRGEPEESLIASTRELVFVLRHTITCHAELSDRECSSTLLEDVEVSFSSLASQTSLFSSVVGEFRRRQLRF